MPILDTFERLALSEIVVKREDRQRRELDTSDLEDSIRQRGVVSPIVVHRGEAGEAILVVGERRLEASRRLGLADIPVRWAEDLSPLELQIIELEENLKRKNLIWQDQVSAILRIHQIHTSLDPEWTMTETSRSLGLALSTVSDYIRVAREIEPLAPVPAGLVSEGSPSGDPVSGEPGAPTVESLVRARIAGASNVREAINIVARRAARAQGNALEELLEPTRASAPAPAGEAEVPVEPSGLVLAEDFLVWARSYSGSKFNFIHCDFPYGGEALGQQLLGSEEKFYENSFETYLSLLECLLESLPRLSSLSSHLMFWCSSRILLPESPYAKETWERFRRLAPNLTFSRFPLIWVKSDNSGIAADPRHGPRHVYEVCLLGSLGGRQIARVVSDAYMSPSDRRLHPSAKPEAMLRHFFSMLVDETTRMLDPTAGSGASLRAAESLGASRVLGLEIDPDYVSTANQALRTARMLRSSTRQPTESGKGK